MTKPWLLAVMLGCAAPAAAQTPPTTGATEALPTDVGLGDMVGLVRRLSPQLAVLRSRVGVAERDVAVANVLPNPSLDYTGYGRIGRGDQYGTQHQVGLETPLWLAGQRAARRRAAERRVEVARAEGVSEERGLERDALQAWLALLAAQQQLDQLEQAGKDIAAVSRTVHERVAAGAESPYDAARVELESAELATRTSSSRRASWSSGGC